MSNSRQGFSAFTAFKPRSVAGPSNAHSAPRPSVAAGPALPPTYPAQPSYSSYSYGQPQYAQPHPQSYQPYAAQPIAYGQTNPNYDPEAEAQTAQWQAAYAARDDNATGANPTTNTGNAALNPADTTAGAGDSAEKKMTVKRQGGGKSWADDSLLEWDPSHFRIFVGNLAGEVTDDSLLKGFSHYNSVQKARVIRDKHTTKSKGFGFVAFSSSDDYFKASMDMQNKYIGSHPVIIRKAKTEIKPTVVRQNKDRKHTKQKQDGDTGDKSAGASGSGSANTGAGIKKKPAKSRNGLKILG